MSLILPEKLLRTRNRALGWVSGHPLKVGPNRLDSLIKKGTARGIDKLFKDLAVCPQTQLSDACVQVYNAQPSRL